MTHKYEHFFLKNKVQVLLYPIKEVRAVTFYLGLNAGSSTERNGKVGTLHFLEHMMFRGSTRFPTAKDVAVTQEELGVASNAWVSSLESRYWFVGPDNRLKEMFDFIFDTITNPLFSKDSVENSRQVILTEQRNHWDEPENVFAKRIRDEIMGKENPYNRVGFGEMDTVKKMTKEKVANSFTKYYVPGNFKISVAGNFKIEKTKSLIEEIFGKLKGDGEKLKYPKPPKRKSEKSYFVYDQPRKQVIFNLSFPLPGYKEITLKNRLERQIFDYLLGSGRTSILYQRLREELGWVYYLFSARAAWPYAGFFEIVGSVDFERIAQTVKEIFSLLREVKRKGFDEKDFSRAIDYLNTSSLVTFSGTDKISEYFLSEMLDEERIHLPEDYNRIANKLSIKKVNELAGSILDFNKMHLSLMGDESLIIKSKVKEVFAKQVQ